MSIAPLAAVDLTAAEQSRLYTLEGVIEHNLEQVGAALREIRDTRLYRGTYGTFEDYCRERWELGRNYVNKKIQAARVIEVLGTNVPSHLNEGQARELAPLLDEPEHLIEVWQEVQEVAAEQERPVTASLIREVVDRDAFTGAAMSSKTDLWATPQDLFDQLHAEFAFETDVCAIAENAKCDRFFTAEDDGLAQEWSGVCWMNPPYGDEIGHWVAKARASATAGATVVCLVPARVDTAWWWDNCRFGEIRFLRGRLKFGDGANSAPFPSAVVVFGRDPKVVWWER